MVFETLDKGVNIKDLVLDGPRNDGVVPFDPDRDLDLAHDYRLQTFKNEWRENFLKALPSERSALDKFIWETHMTFARNISILYPNSLELGREKRYIQYAFDSARESDNPESALQIASSAKIAFGTNNLGLVLKEGDYEKLRRSIQFDTASRRNTLALNAINFADLFIIFPRKRNDLNFSENVWRRYHEELNSLLSDSILSPDRFVHFVAATRLLFPDKKKTLQENRKLWETLREILQDANASDRYAQIAADMKIIAADEINITDNGVEIVMPKPAIGSSTTPPIPEGRKF